MKALKNSFDDWNKRSFEWVLKFTSITFCQNISSRCLIWNPNWVRFIIIDQNQNLFFTQQVWKVGPRVNWVELGAVKINSEARFWFCDSAATCLRLCSRFDVVVGHSLKSVGLGSRPEVGLLATTPDRLDFEKKYLIDFVEF